MAVFQVKALSAGRAKALYAAKHAGQRAGLSWSDHLNGRAGEPLTVNHKRPRGAGRVDVRTMGAEANETATSANTLNGAAIATPRHQQATLDELVV